MKPYSNDLRLKVVEAYIKGQGSLREIANYFGVSLKFVWTLLKKYKETGKVDPKPHQSGNPPKIDKERHEGLRSLVKEFPDATLMELMYLLKERDNIQASRAAIARTIKKLKITVKKKFIRFST
jgi:transposase